jgi:hypothetical protein
VVVWPTLIFVVFSTLWALWCWTRTEHVKSRGPYALGTSARAM